MAAKKKAGKRYGKTAGDKVAKALHKAKQGSLRSGGSGKKVTSRKQAIAIGLSEARSAGGKVPDNKPTKKKASKSAPAKKKASKRKASKKKVAPR